MKSAYDLAMERLRQRDGADRLLSPDQREAIAEIDRQLKAKQAELEILLGGEIAAARATGDAEKLAELERRMTVEITKSRERAEADKDDVRRGGG